LAPISKALIREVQPCKWSPKEKLTTKEAMKKLEKIEKSNSKNDKLLWFGLGVLIGINLFD